MIRQSLLAIFLLVSQSTFAMMGRVIQLRGLLVTTDKAIAILKDDKGVMKVPASSIDVNKMKAGQWIVVNVDLVEFYRLNPDKFKNLGN